MIRLFSALATLAAVLLIVGYARGWFTIVPTGVSADGRSSYSITVDRQKIKEDANKAKETVGNALESARSEMKPESTQR